MVAEVEAVVEVEVGAVVVTAHSWVLHQTRAIDRIKTQALQTGCLGELVEKHGIFIPNLIPLIILK